MVRTSKQRIKRGDASCWRKLIELQKTSGLGVKAWCIEQGISNASYYAWRKRLYGAHALDKNIFQRIEIDSAAHTVAIGLNILLPGGLELRFTELPSVEYIRQLSKTFGGL